MRLNKTQVKSQIVYESSATFDRRPAIMAGYKTYDVIIIGGAGGKSGDALCSKGASYRQDSNAGGGGGTLKLRGNLLDLADLTSIGVGVGGSIGANSANNQKAGDGGNGGTSSFGVHRAYGGSGGIGSRYASNGMVNEQGSGGLGGTNSAMLGAGGVGGFPPMVGFEGEFYPGTLPTSGTYVVGGAAPVQAGGVGGGGGYGDLREAVPAAPTNGVFGSGGSGYSGTGCDESTHEGGCGGGGRIDPLIPPASAPGPTYGTYGVGGAADDPDFIPNGVVAIVLS